MMPAVMPPLPSRLGVHQGARLQPGAAVWVCAVWCGDVLLVGPALTRDTACWPSWLDSCYASCGYRSMHYAHLELQMTQWMPLGCWRCIRCVICSSRWL